MTHLRFFLGLAAALFIVPHADAVAGYDHELRRVVRDYEDAVDLFERELCRCRRASDYVERLAERLERAAKELDDAVRLQRDPRVVALAYDEVTLLHTRIGELLLDPREIPDGRLLQLWNPVAVEFERLVCAVEGCQPVCGLVQYHPAIPAIVSRPPFVSSPSGLIGGLPIVVGRPSLPGHDACDTRLPARGRTVTSITIGPRSGITFGVQSSSPRGGFSGHRDQHPIHHGQMNHGHDDRDRNGINHRDAREVRDQHRGFGDSRGEGRVPFGVASGSDWREMIRSGRGR